MSPGQLLIWLVTGVVCLVVVAVALITVAALALVARDEYHASKRGER